MKRLRHPVRAIREPFGTAGLVVACVALIAALGGTALAAAKLNPTQKKEVQKIAKKFAGKPGAQGPAGPQGPAGAAGANGKDGAPGAKGATGAAGSAGAAGAKGATGAEGASPEVVETLEPGEEECDAGGVVYEAEGVEESRSVLCNGKEGKAGENGQPWTLGGTLPPGAVETGTWAFSRSVETFKTEVGGEVEEVTVGDSLGITVPISFPIPLAKSLGATKVHYATDEDFASFCEVGEANALQPEPANSGELCVYADPSEPVLGTSFTAIVKPTSGLAAEGANKAGAVLLFHKPTADARGEGTFAVKG